jgi:transcription elongation factor S-II
MPVDTLTTIVLTTKGDIRKANITNSSEITIDVVQKYFRKKDEPSELGTYKYKDITYTIIGYIKGKTGTENKHELPAPLNKKYYGDIIVFKTKSGTKWNKDALPMTADEWSAFIKSMKKGDDNDEEEDEEEEEEEDEEEEEEEEEEVEEDEEDEFDKSDDEEDELLEEPEDEMEPEPQIIRRRKATTTNIDANIAAFNEEIELDTPASSHVTRTACLSQLMYIEVKDDPKSPFRKECIEALEKGIFRTAFENAKKHHVPRNWKSVHFHEMYKETARLIIWNIDPRSPVKNKRLRERIMDGEFTLESIASMSAYDLFPENWKESADKMLMREQKILEGNKGFATTMYKCNRCGKRECTYYEMQTRSADEPMTIFITCLNCGKRWRQ